MREARVRIALAGGGTGGHVYPALAISEIARRRLGDVELLFLGVRGRAEEHIVPAAGVPIRYVSGRPLGASPLALARFGGALARGCVQAAKVLREFDPHLVVSTGGYSSAPSVLAAAALRSLRGRPSILVHEQNAAPGRANRLAGRVADRVLTSFEASGRCFPSSSVIHSGYPVRGSITATDPRAARSALGIGPDAFVVLAFGGSGGARSINRAVAGDLPEILSDQSMHVVHGTGRYFASDYDPQKDTSGIVDSLGLSMGELARYHPMAYIEDMGIAYSAADLVVCRAGAGTLAEIQRAGLPALLVPKIGLPHEHQLANARDMQERGAARLILETDDPGHAGQKRVERGLLAAQIRALRDDRAALSTLAIAIRELPRPDTEAIIGMTIELLVG